MQVHSSAATTATSRLAIDNNLVAFCYDGLVDVEVFVFVLPGHPRLADCEPAVFGLEPHAAFTVLLKERARSERIFQSSNSGNRMLVRHVAASQCAVVTRFSSAHCLANRCTGGEAACGSANSRINRRPLFFIAEGDRECPDRIISFFYTNVIDNPTLLRFWTYGQVVIINRQRHTLAQHNPLHGHNLIIHIYGRKHARLGVKFKPCAGGSKEFPGGNLNIKRRHRNPGEIVFVTGGYNSVAIREVGLCGLIHNTLASQIPGVSCAVISYRRRNNRKLARLIISAPHAEFRTTSHGSREVESYLWNYDREKLVNGLISAKQVKVNGVLIAKDGHLISLAAISDIRLYLERNCTSAHRGKHDGGTICVEEMNVIALRVFNAANLPGYNLGRYHARDCGIINLYAVNIRSNICVDIRNQADYRRRNIERSDFYILTGRDDAIIGKMTYGWNCCHR